MPPLEIPEIPDYRWDKQQQPQKDAYRSSQFDYVNQDGDDDNNDDDDDDKPCYQWQKHPADDRRSELRRANSDLTEYEPKVRKPRQHKRRPQREQDDSSSDDGSRRRSGRKPLTRANSDLTGYEPKVHKERKHKRRPKRGQNEDSEGQASSDEDKSMANGTAIRRARSDLTSYESKSTRDKRSAGCRRKKRPTVRFSTEEPQVEIRDTLTDEEKANMYYSKMELNEMRRERDEEKAEAARERHSRTYGNATAQLGSIWGGSSNKVKPNKVVTKLHGDKPKEKSESEKQMESTFEALQLAMAQAKMVTGY